MKFWKNRRGNIAIMAALVMPMLVGGAGLGVETGYWYYSQLKLQQAADAAAYAGDIENQQGNGSSTMLSSATAAATQNGYTSSTDTIALVTPSATYPSDTRSVDVSLTRQVPRLFTAVFNNTPITLRVKATASWKPSTPACLLALDKSASRAIQFQGNGTMNISGCIVTSNSLSSQSIYSQGSSSAVLPCMTTVGGVSLNAGVTFTGEDCTGPLTDQPPTPDPYRNVPIPSAGTCSTGGGNNLSPGTYCGNITINKDQTLAPGTYIFSGGKVSIPGNNVISGTGVTFVFRDGAYLDITGNPTLNFTAPTTGTYAGMLMIGSRTASGYTNKVTGTSGSHMTGIIYFPADPIQYNGDVSGFNGCTQVVADQITWIGNATLSVDCSAYNMNTVQIGGAVRLIG